MESKIKYGIKTIVIDILVVLISFSYVLYRTLDFESKNLDPLQLLIDGIMGIVVGILIKQALGEKGFIKGYESREWKEENEKYNNACSDSIDIMEYEHEFNLKTIEERKLRYRKSTLQGARLKYENFFDENGENKDVVIIPKWKVKNGYVAKENEFVLDIYQRITLHKCYKVKIKILNLFSEYSNNSDNFSDKDTKDSTQRLRVFTKNLLSSFALVFAGLYYAPKFMDGINIGEIIFASVQVLGFIGTGITQLFGNYQFVAIDKVNTTREKVKRISIFINKYKKKGEITENEKLVEETHN